MSLRMKTDETAFRTVVDVARWADPMRRGQRFVLLGSCFAQNMGEMFQSYGLDAVCNPLGAAYNPESIAIQIEQALNNEELRIKNEASLFQYDGKWRCWWANTLLSDTDEERFRETIRRTFSELGEAIREADWLFLTLGTNVCYKLKVEKLKSSKVEKEDSSPFHLFNSSISNLDGMTVANCHKVPADKFEEVTLDVEACTRALSATMELLSKECPRLQVVFTVSPYRYKKYGLHGSQLAKAALLLAVDNVCRLYPKKARYFPAYELLLDDLRDYRFYAEDMIHPAPIAVGYIWRKMVGSCMDEDMQRYLKDYEPTRKAKEHRSHSHLREGGEK